MARPNESHYPLTAAALRAGKHVVCDKPFPLALAEAEALAQLARNKASLSRYSTIDAGTATRAVIVSGILGEISLLETLIGRYRPSVRKRWRESSGPGAGLWFDLGPT